jgi:hypothetical protein
MGSCFGNNNNIDGREKIILTSAEELAQQSFHAITVDSLAEPARGRYAKARPLGAARCRNNQEMPAVQFFSTLL